MMKWLAPATFTLAISSAIVVLMAPATASAQAAADEIQKAVRAGQKVAITDDQGREFNGRISTMTAGGLTVVSRGTPVALPYAGIVRIDRPHDTPANGALIGLGVGAGLGIAALAAEDHASCEPAVFFSCSNPSAGGYVAAAAILGGLGAAVGVGVDALIHRDRNIYRRSGGTHVALFPSFRRGAGAATLSISWGS
jgi:hypothetical protein